MKNFIEIVFYFNTKFVIAKLSPFISLNVSPLYFNTKLVIAKFQQGLKMAFLNTLFQYKICYSKIKS